MLRERYPDKLKEKWLSKKLKCPKPEDPIDGMTLFNMGGVFMVIAIGIVISFCTLMFEYWYIKHRKRTPTIIQVAECSQNTLRPMSAVHQNASGETHGEDSKSESSTQGPSSQGSDPDSSSDSGSDPVSELKIEIAIHQSDSPV